MKFLGNFFLILIVLLVTDHFSSAQCTPDQSFLNAPTGMHPETSANCAFTFTTFTDTFVTGIPIVGELTLHIDQFRLESIIGLPQGLNISTDVEANATGDAPYGTWMNTGSTPGQSNIVGCVSIEEGSASFSSLANGGPNNDGIYPLTFMIDGRIGMTVPDASIIIPNGTWLSTVDTSIGGGIMQFEALFDVNSCGGVVPCNPPTVLFSGLNASYTLTDGPSTLVGAPSGGTFYGPGVQGVEFDPNAAGLGTHGISYVYEDLQGCIGVHSLCTSVSLDVGTSDGSLQSIGVDVYPNPSFGEFSISAPQSLIGSSYSIYDIDGGLILGGILSGLTTMVDLNGVATGAYMVVLVSAEGTHVQRVVITE